MLIFLSTSAIFHFTVRFHRFDVVTFFSPEKQSSVPMRSLTNDTSTLCTHLSVSVKGDDSQIYMSLFLEKNRLSYGSYLFSNSCHLSWLFVCVFGILNEIRLPSRLNWIEWYRYLVERLFSSLFVSDSVGWQLCIYI